MQTLRYCIVLIASPSPLTSRTALPPPPIPGSPTTPNAAMASLVILSCNHGLPATDTEAAAVHALHPGSQLLVDPSAEQAAAGRRRWPLRLRALRAPAPLDQRGTPQAHPARAPSHRHTSKWLPPHNGAIIGASSARCEPVTLSISCWYDAEPACAFTFIEATIARISVDSVAM